jgi:hypothetical protein
VSKFKSKYVELFSLSYFQSSFKQIPSIIKGKSKPEATLNRYNNLGTKLTDGSLIYGEKYRKATQEEIDNKIISSISRKVVKASDRSYVISEKKWKEFELLIIDMKKNNIDVAFFLTPFAPLAYEKLKKDYQIVEQKTKDFSSSNKIKVFGSFDPSNFGLDKTFFYDDKHVKESGIKRIFELDK